MPRPRKKKQNPPSQPPEVLQKVSQPIVVEISDYDSEADINFLNTVILAENTVNAVKVEEKKNDTQSKEPKRKKIKRKNKKKVHKRVKLAKSTTSKTGKARGASKKRSSKSKTKSCVVKSPDRVQTGLCPLVSCEPVLEPVSSKFVFKNSRLFFGEASNPTNAALEFEAGPSLSSSKTVKPRRLPIKIKNKLPPIVEKPVIISPIKSIPLDMEQAHLPTAEEIVEIFMKAKENNIPLSEAEWPVCLKGAKHENDILPKKEFELDSEQENFDHEKTETGPDGDSFNSKRRRVVQDTDPKKRNQWDDELAMGPMQIGLEEEREMMEWIKSEMLNEPLSDIEEFDMLLSLAKDYPKNHNLLFQLLTPKKKVSDVVKSVEEKPKAVYIAPKNIVKANVDTKCLAKGPINTKIIHEPMEIKQAPVVILPFLKPDLIEPAESPMEIQVEEPPPEVPTIVDVKDIVPVQPMPEDEQAINEWLQQCSLTISQQLQAIIDEECGPNTNTSGGVDFEREITREQLTNHRNGQMLLNRMPPGQESAWQSSYRVRLEDFEDVIDQNMTQVRNAQEKQISSKWKQLYGTDNLRRSLKMPPLPIHLDQCLKRIRILRRPTKPKVEEFHLRIDMKFCKMFCSLQMGASINLNVAVNRLENAVYSTEIDVIQKRYTATQIAWIWANGTILIINGRGQNMLAETQRMLISKLNGQNNFKAKPENQLVHLRLISYAYYPWTINLAEFCETYVLCSHPMQTMHYVYYVDKSLPGVAARVHASGMIHVFAKSTIDADKMLQKLYLITANHRTS